MQRVRLGRKRNYFVGRMGFVCSHLSKTICHLAFLHINYIAIWLYKGRGGSHKRQFKKIEPNTAVYSFHIEDVLSSALSSSYCNDMDRGVRGGWGEALAYIRTYCIGFLVVLGGIHNI